VDDASKPTIALLPWGDVYEDWLEPLGVSLEAFRDEMRGSWMFGYIDALQSAGVRVVLVCVSAGVDRPVRWTHRPTGAPMYVLPPPPLWRLARRGAAREPRGALRKLRRIGPRLLWHLSPYVGTPLRALAQTLRSERCDAILCQEYETARFDACVLLGRMLGLPVFATYQGGDYQVSRLERPVRPLTIRRSAGLIIATRSEAERVTGRYRISTEKIARIFNPLDADLWRATDQAEARAKLGIDPEAAVAIWHGQIQLERKGLDIIVEAWERVSRVRPGRKLELVLIGDGQDANELHRRVRGMPDIRFVRQWVLDWTALREMLSAADLYVFASRHEGFPVAPVEAMACSLPVVATGGAGIPDILESGESSGGVVTPVEDAVALADGLGRVLDDSAWRKELGANARRRVEEAFSQPVVGKELRALLGLGPGYRSARDSDSGPRAGRRRQ
jgi:glycosyltransferase involved in cell wall biosynthesis